MKRIENIKSARTSGIGKRGAAAAAAGTLLLGLFLLPMAGTGRGTISQATVQGSGGPVLESAGAFAPEDAPVVREVSRYGSPLQGKTVTAGFGPMRDPFTGKEMDHSGVDIKASRGSAVHAIADGKAVKAVTRVSGRSGKRQVGPSGSRGRDVQHVFAPGFRACERGAGGQAGGGHRHSRIDRPVDRSAPPPGDPEGGGRHRSRDGHRFRDGGLK